jgi:hypothetical protein
MRDYVVAFLLMLALFAGVLFVGSPAGHGIHWPDLQRSASVSR